MSRAILSMYSLYACFLGITCFQIVLILNKNYIQMYCNSARNDFCHNIQSRTVSQSQDISQPVSFSQCFLIFTQNLWYREKLEIWKVTLSGFVQLMQLRSEPDAANAGPQIWSCWRWFRSTSCYSHDVRLDNLVHFKSFLCFF